MRQTFRRRQSDQRAQTRAAPEVDELLRILDLAVEAAADADTLLSGRGLTDGPRTDARAALRARVRLAELEHALTDVACVPNDEPVRDRAIVIVTFYQYLLAHAVHAQYSAVAPARSALRSAHPLTGDHTELAAIRDALRASAYGTRP